MGYYNEVVNDYMKSGKGTEAKTKEVIMLMDAEVFEPMLATHPVKYWGIMRKMHEVYEGAHYNEPFAKWEVSQMHHTDATGKKVIGEYWSIAQVTPIFEQHKAKIGLYNVYDVYVALNANYHDKIMPWAKWFAPEAIDAKIIEDAISFYFLDEDSADGKVWNYMNAVRKEQ